MKLLNSKLFKVIILNIIVLGTLMLFFTPSLKTDDYYMSEILYGTASGVYDEHLLYCNVLLGYFLKFLLSIFPGIAWFTVSQVVSVFVSLLFFSYIIFRRFSNKIAFAILIPTLYTIGYAGYIKISFTQTSAIITAVGLFAVFHGIYYGYKIQKKYIIFGAIFIFVGMLYRNATWNMILFILACIVAVEFIISLKEKKIKYSISRLIVSLCVIILCSGMRTGLNNYNHYVYSISPGWENYFSENSLKSQIVDFTSKNYNFQYEEIGVSENDLNLMYSNDALYDDEFMTAEKYEKVISIAEGEDNSWQNIFSFKNISSFFKEFFSYYFAYSCILCVVFLMLVMCTQYRVRTFLIWLLGFILVFAENYYYVFVRGRTGQYHIDVGIIIAYCLYVIYFLKEPNHQISQWKYVASAFLLGIWGILGNYSWISSEAYNTYGNNLAARPDVDKKYTNILTLDKEHLYFGPDMEIVYSKWNFGTFEVMPKSYYSNYLCTLELLWPTQKSILSNYGIEHPFREIINSDVMFFVVSDIIEDQLVDEFQTYINEHYADGEAQFVKVKEMGYINIYRCIDGYLDLDIDVMGNAQTVGDATYSWEKDALYVNADCYIENTNSYETQYYLEISDAASGESTYYLMDQTENKDHKDIMNGQFSNATAVIEDVDSIELQSCDVNIIMYDGNAYYRVAAQSF